jgi:hypothetical protein
VFCGLVSAVGFAGCYGSTEPATDVGIASAKLNARGTADRGPATSWFEYWLTSSSSPPAKTDPLHWPAGASGHFGVNVSGLAANSSYSFRLCGTNDSTGGSICAQTLTFKTLPVEDSVTGFFDIGGGGAQGTIDAHSGPSGQNPRGHVHYQGTIDGWRTFDGDVNCVAVNGHQGEVGAVGQGTTLTDPSNPRAATLLLKIVDGHGVERDSIAGAFANGSTPPDCASTLASGQFALSPPQSELVVTDAPATTPTSAR